METNKYVSVYFDDEDPLLEAVKKLRELNETIIDVLTPFPVHGLDKALSLKRSRIPMIGFIFGALGGIFGFLFQTWVFTSSYPLVFGGKPLLSAPSFIPVTFECTILFAGISMFVAFLVKSKLKPDKKFVPIDEDITDDMFVILVDVKDNNTTAEKIKSGLAGIQIVKIT